MGLFSKDEPTIDKDLAALIHPSNAQARKQFARSQEIIQQALSDGEDIRLVGVDLDRWGNPITVVTNRRLMRCKRDGVESQAPLPVTDLALVPLQGTWWGATGNPSLDVHFRSFGEANAFLVALDARDIPQLYPAFFERVLHATDLPVTPTNMGRLIERVARMIMAGGAYSYFNQRSDATARRSFDERFAGDLPPQAILSACDDMIDWLWRWRVTCHAALRELIPKIEILLVSEDSPLSRAEAEVPPMEW